MWPCKFIHLMSAFRTTSQIFLNYIAIIISGEICSLLTTTLNFIALTTQLHVNKYSCIYSRKLSKQFIKNGVNINVTFDCLGIKNTGHWVLNLHFSKFIHTLNFLTVPTWLTVKFHYLIIGAKVKIFNIF
jgi:hypothetical protein